MGNKLGAFLAGGLAGAVIALLYAPRSGKETRAMVTEKVNTAWGEAQELGAQASANAQQMYQEATAKGQDIAQSVAEKAARQRIAAQVAKNAEAAHDKVSEKIPVAAEAAQDFADTAKEKADQAAERIASHEAASGAEAPEPCEAPAGQPCHGGANER